jgi:hypothetical protein
MTITGSFVISLVSDNIPRNLTFKYFAEVLKESQSDCFQENSPKNTCQYLVPRLLRRISQGFCLLLT